MNADTALRGTPRRRASISARTGGWLLTVLAPLVLFAVLAVLWQWTASVFKSVLPPIQDILADIARRPPFYLSNLGVTLQSALLGLLFGVVVALALGAAVVHFRFLRAAIMPVALLLNVTPIVAIAPALVVAFGFNETPRIIVAALSAFFPMLINAIAGLRAVDPQALEVFDAMAASRREIFFRLRVPSSLPYLFAGARLAITAAMVGAVVSEFSGSSKGLGAVIVTATTYLNLPQMWAAILFSALTTLCLMGLVGLLERLIVRW
ncbi:ABC transporter permease [Microbacterium sp. SORGH_AS_0888]|uniref:ABC transporter permease n=1 Tax=Microbacterium sp. SORGH_AS_0888 TaxID=3041791 RepID=UPI0027839E48|nr:ABC transporter permease [Microbacterium sp. SORGH_AS_0888]MDQ1131299.1 NitT/TauT family transport system permease protein [Microbacterium sp. SORGH_AS_0888]